jgi:hypothetical protein
LGGRYSEAWTLRHRLQIGSLVYTVATSGTIAVLRPAAAPGGLFGYGEVNILVDSLTNAFTYSEDPPPLLGRRGGRISQNPGIARASKYQELGRMGF